MVPSSPHFFFSRVNQMTKSKYFPSLSLIFPPISPIPNITYFPPQWRSHINQPLDPPLAIINSLQIMKKAHQNHWHRKSLDATNLNPLKSNPSIEIPQTLHHFASIDEIHKLPYFSQTQKRTPTPKKIFSQTHCHPSLSMCGLVSLINLSDKQLKTTKVPLGQINKKQ